MDTLKKIATYKSRIATLEGKLHAELSKLPGKYGFSNIEAFIAELRRAKGPSQSKSAKARKAGGRKKRAKITDEIRQKVKALVGAKKTSAVIARDLKISVPTVQNVKKALGLVKARR